MSTDALTDEPVDHFLARVRAIRWLEPDAGMATLDEDARRFLDERADEHRAAVRRASDSPLLLEPAALALRVTRSLREARDASAHATDATELREFSPGAMRWLEALEHARAAALRAAHARCGAATCAAVTERAWQTLRALPGVSAPVPPPPGYTGPIGPPPGIGAAPDIAYGAPGGEAVVAHAWWLLAYGAAHADESPWAPLVALWERGTCPLATPEGALLVYIPVRHDGQLVAEPDGPPTRAATPGGWTPPPTFSAGIAAWSSWGRGPQPPEPENARDALKRFNRVGFGPLPGMYTPPNMAWPGMTNWPGPPDLYIVRPPTAPTTDEQIASLARAYAAVDTEPAPPTPNPVPGPDLFADQPPPEGVPWYRRLFRRRDDKP